MTCFQRRGWAPKAVPEQFSDQMHRQARCIIYLVDSDDKPKLKDLGFPKNCRLLGQFSMQDVAEHFYELLTHRAGSLMRLQIALFCFTGTCSYILTGRTC